MNRNTKIILGLGVGALVIAAITKSNAATMAAPQTLIPDYGGRGGGRGNGTGGDNFDYSGSNYDTIDGGYNGDF